MDFSQMPILTITQTAIYLRISKCQVYVLMRDHGLPYIWVGKSRRVGMVQLKQWLNRNAVGVEDMGPVKRTESPVLSYTVAPAVDTGKRKPGRPKKVVEPVVPAKRGPGRPRKAVGV